MASDSSSNGMMGISSSEVQLLPVGRHWRGTRPGGRYAELADTRLEGRVLVKEVERMVKVALSYPHEDPHLRPSMAVVVSMEGTMELCDPRLQSISFLRLYGRGCAGSTAGGGSDDINFEHMRSAADRSGTTTLTTMSEWPLAVVHVVVSALCARRSIPTRAASRRGRTGIGVRSVAPNFFSVATT
jgi:hypothetical protein